MGDFKGLFTAILLLGVIFGGGVVAILFWLVPWLWGLIKPWLHVVTA